jgi:hypothetical protein
MHTNIKVLGWLHIVMGILGLLAGLLVFFVLVTAGFFVAEEGVFPILFIVGFFVAGIVALFSAPSIVVGIGLLQFWSWARVLALVLAVLNLFNFPLGTALGIYTFVSLLNADAERAFRRR